MKQQITSGICVECLVCFMLPVKFQEFYKYRWLNLTQGKQCAAFDNYNARKWRHRHIWTMLVPVSVEYSPSWSPMKVWHSPTSVHTDLNILSTWHGFPFHLHLKKK